MLTDLLNIQLSYYKRLQTKGFYKITKYDKNVFLGSLFFTMSVMNCIFLDFMFLLFIFFQIFPLFVAIYSINGRWSIFLKTYFKIGTYPKISILPCYCINNVTVGTVFLDKWIETNSSTTHSWTFFITLYISNQVTLCFCYCLFPSISPSNYLCLCLCPNVLLYVTDANILIAIIAHISRNHHIFPRLR